jgi:hypothetical protein
MPKSAFTAFNQSESLCAPQWTHFPSFIDPRYPRKGSASGPTGCRNCHVPDSTISQSGSRATWKLTIGSCFRGFNFLFADDSLAALLV